VIWPADRGISAMKRLNELPGRQMTRVERFENAPLLRRQVRKRKTMRCRFHSRLLPAAAAHTQPSGDTQAPL
jgi:hypothetical protein